MDIDYAHSLISEACSAHTVWNQHPALRDSRIAYNWHFATDSGAPKSLGTADPVISTEALEIQPEWRKQKKFEGNSSFRLFGEVVPSFTGNDHANCISTVVSILKRHYKLLIITASCEIELSKLANRFPIELNSLLDYLQFNSRNSSPPPTDVFALLIHTFKPLLKLSETLETHPNFLHQVSLSLRLTLLHWLYLYITPASASSKDPGPLQDYLIQVLESFATISNILCRPFALQSPSSQFYTLQLQYLQTLFRHQLKFDAESTMGSSMWRLVCSATKNLVSSEAKWSLVLLSAAVNSSALIGDNSPLYYPGWDVVQDLLSSDLLKTPSNARNSPTKDPTGPTRGIYDLMHRFRYLCSIWPTPPQELMTILSRYFAERLWRSYSAQLEYYEPDALDKSTSAFDVYLSVLLDAVYSSPAAETRKIRISITKNIEIFLNILDDLPDRNLESNAELPQLLRNCFQFAISIVSFMSDTDVQNVLLERLLSFDVETLSPFAARIAIQGMFKLLAALSKKRLVGSGVVKKEVKDELEDIYGFLASDYEESEEKSASNTDASGIYLRNVDIELVPFEGARKNLVTSLSGKMLNYIVTVYLQLLSNASPSSMPSHQSAQQTATAHLTQATAKKLNFGSLEIDMSGGPISHAEKMIVTYLKQMNRIFSKHLSLASVGLLDSPRIGELLASVGVSLVIRQQLNETIHCLIVSSRYTTLESEIRQKLELLWKSAVKPFNSPSSPSKVVQSIAEFQGLLVHALGDYNLWQWSEVIATVYRKDAIFRTTPIFGLRSWLSLLTSLVKSNMYRTPLIPANTAFAIGSILINACLEANAHPFLSEILQQLRAFGRLAVGNYPPALHLLGTYIIDVPTLELCQRNPPSGIIAKKILENFLNFKSSQPSKAHELATFFPLLLQHIDVVIIQCRSELNSATSTVVSTKRKEYDDMIYPCVVYFMKTVPFWLQGTTNSRYNVFKGLFSELFTVPIQSMAVANSSDHLPSSDAAQTKSHSNPNVTQSNATTIGTGMVLGGARKLPTARSSSVVVYAQPSNPSNAHSKTQAKARNPIGPKSVNENAISMLPQAMHALAQLDLDASAELQKHLCDITIGVFKSFLTGEEGTPDARLIEQFSSGFLSFESASEASRPETIVLHGRLKLMRMFFFANIVPWLTKSIEKESEDVFDTNGFVLARILSWIILKLKHIPNSSMELVHLFLLSIHFLLDLFRTRKPTSSSLMKTTTLNFVVTFCSTILKVVPHTSVLAWIKSQDASAYELLLTSFNEIAHAIMRDIEYVLRGKWPTAVSEAESQTPSRLDHVNAIFKAGTQNRLVNLSSLVLVDPGGTIEGLKDLAKTHLLVLDFIRQLGASDLITKTLEPIKTIIYDDDTAMVQRRARADVKGALEVWKREWSHLSYLLKRN